MDHRTADGLALDHAEPDESGEGLLDRPQAELVAEESVDLPTCQRNAGTQQHGKDLPACARNQAPEGLPKSHMTTVAFI